MAETIAISTHQHHSWRLPFPDTVPEAQRPLFHFRSGTIMQRKLFDAEVDMECGRQPSQIEIDIAFAQGLAILLPDDPDECARIIGLRAQHLEFLKEAAQSDSELINPLSPADIAVVEESFEQVKRIPPLRRLVLASEARSHLLPVIAFRFFCTGWENLLDMEGKPIPFKRDRNQMLATDVLEQIEDSIISVAGWHAAALQYGAGLEKNSLEPSRSDATPKASDTGSVASETDT